MKKIKIENYQEIKEDLPDLNVFMDNKQKLVKFVFDGNECITTKKGFNSLKKLFEQ